MSSQTTSHPQHPETLTEPITRDQLRRLFADLRTLVDLELDRLTKLSELPAFRLDGLSRIEGLLSTYEEFATQWRPSDTLDLIHTHLESITADVRRRTATPALGAFLKSRPSTESPVPDRHRSDSPTLGREIVR